MTTGLLINGALHDVPGLSIVPPASHGGPERCQLSPEDYRSRHGTWVSKITPHTTGGHWPQPIIPGKGPAGRALEIFDMWRGKDGGGGQQVYSAAHIVIDFDGTIFCGVDLVRVMAYHATAINPTSVGIEMCTRSDGGLYEATLAACAGLLAALAHSGRPVSGLLPVPFQFHKGPYRKDPLPRLEVSGHALPGNDVVGVIGHREQTGRRGQGDPGDAIYTSIAAMGAEALDYNAAQDLELGKRRQRALVARGLLADGDVDGICGPRSISAMKTAGFRRWRDVE